MKTKATFTLSSEAQELLVDLATYFGLSKTAVLELLIREKSRVIKRENVQIQALPIEKE